MYWKFYYQKKWKFSDKNSVIFHTSAQNIYCGYSQYMFWAEIRKKMYTPVNPSFTIWKWGLRGSKLYRYVFVIHSVVSNESVSWQIPWSDCDWPKQSFTRFPIIQYSYSFCLDWNLNGIASQRIIKYKQMKFYWPLHHMRNTEISTLNMGIPYSVFVSKHFNIGLDKNGYQVNSFLISRKKHIAGTH